MGTSSKKLIYFTASFPFGLGQTWKLNELKYFIEYFKEITVVPYSYGGNFTSPKNLPQGVTLKGPLFESDNLPVSMQTILKLIDRNFFYYFREFLRKRVFLSKKKLISWAQASMQIKMLLRHPLVRDIMRNPNEDTVLYFFWGRGSCDFLPFIRKGRFGKKVARFHGYDLFEYRNGGYIPYRRQLLKSLDIAAPSSGNGREHLQAYYPKFRDKIKTFRLGVLESGEVEASKDGIFRIVSCSYLVPLKRIDIVVKALSYLDFPVEWTHIGDGPLMADIKDLAERLPDNINVHFPGMIKSNDVMAFYKARSVDLFINVSSTEGVPVSIMEALSLGIPVFATNVGGTGEIIDNEVGELLPANIDPRQLANHMEAFYKENSEKKIGYRIAAKERFREKCNAEILAREFAGMLISQ